MGKNLSNKLKTIKIDIMKKIMTNSEIELKANKLLSDFYNHKKQEILTPIPVH